MLLGRDAECRRIDAVLDDARVGSGRALVIVGEAGIGKTALLDWARARAGDMRVLDVTGVRSESDLAWSTLLQLVRPMLGLIERLPAPQRDALEAALALVPVAGALDQFSVGAGLLTLLAEAADDRPLLVLADDAQWVDAASLAALLFAARRLRDDRVAFLVTVRTDERTPVEISGLEAVEVCGLDRDATAELVARMHKVPPTAEVVDRIFGSTRGNPLAIVELRDIGPLVIAAGLPASVSEAVEERYAERIRRLPPRTRTALLVAAADESLDAATIARALASVGSDVAALDDAEHAGLVDLRHGRVRFRHPLVRSAVYQTAPARDRRSAHAALGRALDDGPAKTRRVMHRSLAAVEPSEDLACELAAIGRDARARGAHAAAGAAFARAAALTPDGATAATRLHAAAEASWNAGATARARVLLDAALERCDSPLLRADLQLLRARIAYLADDREALDELILEAERVAPLDGRRAAAMLSWAFDAAQHNERFARALEIIETARTIPGITDDDIPPLGIALCLDGRCADAAAILRRQAAAQDADDPHAVTFAAQCLGWLGRYREAHAVAGRALDLAREQGVPAAIPLAADVHGESAYALGDFAASVTSCDEAVHFARDVDVRMFGAFAAWTLAAIAAIRGQHDRCEAHLRDATGFSSNLAFGMAIDAVACVRGLLRLSTGDAGAARDLLTGGVDLDQTQAANLPMPYAFDLVEACVRARDLRAAERAIERVAGHCDQPWAIAGLARSRGLIASAADGDAQFLEAISISTSLATTLEEARARLLYGEWLRRAGRRVEARDQLRLAHARFERIAAVPWIERARAELAASGETLASRRGVDVVDALTPQELQVARLVAAGASNREAAARLFLSTKTIEAHLRRAYRKLDISGRAGLAPLLQRSDDEALRHS